VRTILIADLVMSLDNVIGVAAAAKGNLLLLGIGLALSIPMVIFGSSLLIGLMQRFPFIIKLGAALIGWVAGETLISDVLLAPLIEPLVWLHWLVPAAGALLVLASGHWRNSAQTPPAPTDVHPG
jgi:predicted tellurium resistance membrane protein TerC